MASPRSRPAPIDPRMRPSPPILDSMTLFRGAREARILHQGEEYRLRITRQNRLILTK
jgi:hemin uptake protein HemP